MVCKRKFTPAVKLSRWSHRSWQLGASHHSLNHFRRMFGLSALLYFGAAGMRMTRCAASKNRCREPSLAGRWSSSSAARTTSTGSPIVSEKVNSLAFGMSPGRLRRRRLVRQASQSTLPPSDNRRCHASSHFFGSTSQAIGVPPSSRSVRSASAFDSRHEARDESHRSA